jgi:lipid-A-disaccharide synthase-like uncharacterized protein/protein tyrosine/serine phosphatase
MLNIILFSVLALLAFYLAFRLVRTLIARGASNGKTIAVTALGMIVCVAAATLLALLHVGYLGENFHSMTDGVCYRSAQLSPETLRARVTENGIKTVINLRGSSKKEWHEKQEEVLNELDVDLHDIAFDTERLPTPQNVALLLDTFRTAPKPFLLHCSHGVDRTGIAAVLFKTVVEQEPLDRAITEEQSIWSGHFATPHNDAGDRFFELYENEHTDLPIENWIRTVYPARYEETLREAAEIKTAGWINAPLRLGPVVLTPFKCLGILGAALFACRWFVQAYYSRRAGRPVTPMLFWLMSVVGSLLMLFYFMFSAKQDIVGIISNMFPAGVAAYNVFLEIRFRARERAAHAKPFAGAPSPSAP